MKPILKSETFLCPNCNAEFELEKNDIMPGYCKHCEIEFDEDVAEKAYKFLVNEIFNLSHAPEVNGCDMAEEWAEQLEICKYLLSKVRSLYE